MRTNTTVDPRLDNIVIHFAEESKGEQEIMTPIYEFMYNILTENPEALERKGA